MRLPLNSNESIAPWAVNPRSNEIEWDLSDLIRSDRQRFSPLLTIDVGEHSRFDAGRQDH